MNFNNDAVIKENLSNSKSSCSDIYNNRLTVDERKYVQDKLEKATKSRREAIFKNYLESKYCRVKKSRENYISVIEKSPRQIREYINKTNKAVESVYDFNSIDELLQCYKYLTTGEGKKENKKYSNNLQSAAINNYIKAIIAYAMDLIDDQKSKIDSSQSKNTANTDNKNSNIVKLEYLDKELPLQVIFYGSPGCGKSHELKKMLNDNKIGSVCQFRTTFHPDMDYYSFVGAYKPKRLPDTGSITYDFSPQIFTKAYIKAWENIDKVVVLVIEEINRGNCAQIFGDLFQLLDRDSNGYSEYPIKADEDLIMYIKNHCNNSDAYSNDELRLPPNLYIVATMNTSDQSLFPMDSAFKRRWAWKYVPINYNNQDSDGFNITIGGINYGWHNFLKKINDKIYKVTQSEDKMLGNFFIKKSISEEEFVDKIMFYLWNDVLKLEYASGNDYFFRTEDNSKFKFSDLYDSNTKTSTLESFMKYLGL